MEAKKDFWIKFVRYNFIGSVCFLVNTLLFGLLASLHYWMAWFIANLSGGVMAFLIYYYKVNIHRAEAVKPEVS